ncbi:hypothetical protein NPIL_354721 [Nephila pilipes]|uniref:Uncharacterized protein n=1 Tax=Nephila pilipes TaxID=299642 RepID=A0A8X6IIU1_NEPPI|nr:hypothetical protein NPIL_354721 [Nephila pilipes]
MDGFCKGLNRDVWAWTRVTRSIQGSNSRRSFSHNLYPGLQTLCLGRVPLFQEEDAPVHSAPKGHELEEK